MLKFLNICILKKSTDYLYNEAKMDPINKANKVKLALVMRLYEIRYRIFLVNFV